MFNSKFWNITLLVACFLLFLASFSNLKMEIIYSSEIQIKFQLHTRCYTPQGDVKRQSLLGNGQPSVNRRKNKKSSALKYIRAALFLGEINTEIWPSGFLESWIGNSEVQSKVTLDSDLRVTALARISNNCKRQICLPFKRHQQTRNNSTKNLALGLRWGLISRYTGRLIMGRNINLSFESQ